MWPLVAVAAALLLQACTYATAAAAPDNSAAFATRVVELTNLERQKAGLPPLATSPQLDRAAQQYSEVLAGSTCFQHTCGPFPNFADRIDQAGYTDWQAVGENLALGYPTPESVVEGWMGSAGHRANILSARFTEIGIGVVHGERQICTQEFGARFDLASGAPESAEE